MRRQVLMLAVALAIPAPALADTGAADTELANIAFQTCLAYPDNPKRLKFRLDARLKMAEESTEDFFLGQNKGKVWLDRKADANFAVVIFDSGRCVVEGDAVSIDGVIQAFAAHADSAKLPLKQVADDPKGSFRGAPGHTRRYDWTYDRHDYRIDLAGTPLASALVHAEIAVEPVK